MPESEEAQTYPSLPEPYINLFIPIDSNSDATLKGVSETASIFEVSSGLFGVRLNLLGYLWLNLGKPGKVTNRLVSFSALGSDEKNLISDFEQSETFVQRVDLFRKYIRQKLTTPISLKEQEVSEAFEFLVSNYHNPSLINQFAELRQVSPRTISRLMTSFVEITPKRIARIARFHQALSGLHRDDSRFFMECGYFDQAHFIREFKEFTSLTPQAYLSLVSKIGS